MPIKSLLIELNDYIIHVPETLIPERRITVFVRHGGGERKGMNKLAGFNKADKYGLIVCHPQELINTE
jgi:poly(3-hydroxybutyrate) depolymerase